MSQLVAMAPAILVYVVGCVLAVCAFSKCRRAATWLLVGLAILIVARASFPLLIWLITDVLRNNNPQFDVQTAVSAASFLAGLLHAGGIACLIAAALVDRAPPQSRSPWIDGDPPR